MDEYQILMILTVVFMILSSIIGYKCGVEFGYEQAFYHYIEGGEKILFNKMGVNTETQEAFQKSKKGSDTKEDTT